MANRGLPSSRVSVPQRLGLVDDPSHLPPLLVRQIDVSGRPVLLQPRGLGRAGNGDHALRGHPRERDLRQRAAPA